MNRNKRSMRGKQKSHFTDYELAQAVEEGWEYFWTRPHRINLPDNPRNFQKEFNYYTTYPKKKASTLEQSE